jgi:6-phosphogluconolactonase/glucosamine-6-phosphate isomerase/deaminase
MKINACITKDEAVHQVVASTLLDLYKNISRFGFAALCLPGGATAIPVLKHLAECPFPWEKVFIFLTDEKLVPKGDESSNEFNFKKYFLNNINPISSYIEAPRDQGELEEIKAHFGQIFIDKKVPTSILIGMGEDGHVASLFTQKDTDNEGIYCFTSSPNGINRVSLTLDFIASASNISLLFFGLEKFEQFQLSVESSVATPLAKLLQRCSDNISVTYCIN